MTDPSRSALVLLSGGQDSATCLAWALDRFDRVETIGFDYGQRHRIELTCRARIRERLTTAFPAWAPRFGPDHLLDAGVNLVYIRDFLGHESVTTTEIYARASVEAKRRAIESAECNIVPESPYGKEERADLVAWLRGII